VLKFTLHLNFQLHLVDEIAIHDLQLFHALQSIDLVGTFPSYFLHHAEGALPETLLDIELLKAI
jgi:hypothetical protein